MQTLDTLAVLAAMLIGVSLFAAGVAVENAALAWIGFVLTCGGTLAGSVLIGRDPDQGRD
jgi:hypothetical protein